MPLPYERCDKCKFWERGFNGKEDWGTCSELPCHVYLQEPSEYVHTTANFYCGGFMDIPSNQSFKRDGLKPCALWRDCKYVNGPECNEDCCSYAPAP